MENQTIPRMPISAFVTNKRLKTNHSYGPKKFFAYNRISPILKSYEKKSGNSFLQKTGKKDFLQVKFSFYCKWRTQTIQYPPKY